MGWSELNIEPALTVVWNGQQFGARRFKVWGGASRTQIAYEPQSIANDSGQTLDPRGSQWNGMYLDSYTVNGVGAGVYDVTALYSTEQQRRKHSSSFQTENIQIPYSKRGSVAIPEYLAPTGSGIIERFGWTIAEQSFQMSVGRLFCTVNFSVFGSGGGESPLFMDIIKGKLNELHKPFGSPHWHRFESADVVYLGGFDVGSGQDSALYYQASYAWVYESGLLLPQGWNNTTASNAQLVKYPDGVTSRLEDGNGDGLWLVPPFHKLVPYREGGNVNLPFSFEAVLPYKQNEFGWGDLPGIN